MCSYDSFFLASSLNPAQVLVQYPEHIFYPCESAPRRDPGIHAMPTTDSTPATAVERALNILENIAHRRGGLTNSEISRKLAITKSSASYILRTLECSGYLL